VVDVEPKKKAAPKTKAGQVDPYADIDRPMGYDALPDDE
jgi:hypothetical protein